MTPADAEPNTDSQNASPLGKKRSLAEMGLLKCGPPLFLVAVLARDQLYMQTHESEWCVLLTKCPTSRKCVHPHVHN